MLYVLTQDANSCSYRSFSAAMGYGLEHLWGCALDGARLSGRARQQRVRIYLFGKGLQQPALAQGDRQACAVEDPQGARHSQGMCTRGCVIAVA